MTTVSNQTDAPFTNAKWSSSLTERIISCGNSSRIQNDTFRVLGALNWRSEFGSFSGSYSYLFPKHPIISA